ncbi:MAG: polysaccharide deacetylase family protein [Clostridiales bacterium]|nr:polysaccharide deacetylase family protein [Clostridiales bacterium]
MKKIKYLFFVLFYIIIFCSNTYAEDAAKINPYTQSTYCPVLCYHHLTVSESQTSSWSVTPEKFEKDIKTLLDHGYTPIFTEELISAEIKKTKLPEKPVIIHFDDGYSSVYELAYPILHKYHAKAEVYIITDYTKDIPSNTQTDTFLSWPQLSVMKDSGLVYVGLHGKNHKPVTSGFTDQQIKDNFETAWKTIEEHLGKSPKYYVYPHGAYNVTTLDLIQKSNTQMQFIWIWNVRNVIQPYNVLARTNVDQKTDILTCLSAYEKAYHQFVNGKESTK